MAIVSGYYCYYSCRWRNLLDAAEPQRLAWARSSNSEGDGKFSCSWRASLLNRQDYGRAAACCATAVCRLSCHALLQIATAACIITDARAARSWRARFDNSAAIERVRESQCAQIRRSADCSSPPPLSAALHEFVTSAASWRVSACTALAVA
eukprot:SAG11_NODE_6664_length_1271_cov_1.338737_3_plen_152_part_00